jgi:hypothetical protein
MKSPRQLFAIALTILLGALYLRADYFTIDIPGVIQLNQDYQTNLTKLNLLGGGNSSTGAGNNSVGVNQNEQGAETQYKALQEAIGAPVAAPVTVDGPEKADPARSATIDLLATQIQNQYKDSALAAAVTRLKEQDLRIQVYRAKLSEFATMSGRDMNFSERTALQNQLLALNNLAVLEKSAQEADNAALMAQMQMEKARAANEVRVRQDEQTFETASGRQ